MGSSASIRVNVYFSPTQLPKLKEEAKALGIRFSDLIRRIVHKHQEPRQ